MHNQEATTRRRLPSDHSIQLSTCKPGTCRKCRNTPDSARTRSGQSPAALSPSFFESRSEFLRGRPGPTGIWIAGCLKNILILLALGRCPGLDEIDQERARDPMGKLEPMGRPAIAFRLPLLSGPGRQKLKLSGCQFHGAGFAFRNGRSAALIVDAASAAGQPKTDDAAAAGRNPLRQAAGGRGPVAAAAARHSPADGVDFGEAPAQARQEGKVPPHRIRHCDARSRSGDGHPTGRSPQGL